MRLWLVLVVSSLCACATAPRAKSGADPLAYWPLVSGQKMLFSAEAAGAKVKRTIRVKGLGKGWFQVGPGQRLRHDADGLFDGQRYLMRRPLVSGTAWDAIPRPGVIERFKVVRVDASCSPVHSMAKICMAIEARQNIGDQVLLTRWWYGKGVGLLRVEVFTQASSGTLHLQSRLERVEGK